MSRHPHGKTPAAVRACAGGWGGGCEWWEGRKGKKGRMHFEEGRSSLPRRLSMLYYLFLLVSTGDKLPGDGPLENLCKVHLTESAMRRRELSHCVLRRRVAGASQCRCTVCPTHRVSTLLRQTASRSHRWSYYAILCIKRANDIYCLFVQR